MSRDKQLTRPRDDRWIGGVCSGVARYAGVDPTVVRLVTVVLTVIGFGSMIVIYLVAWLLMPNDPPATAWSGVTDQTSPPPSA
ncbi:phage shock protein PspC (stress-responsive transcriptional regulator) [Mumia flava]|uniref:Phage shock protein PspC (Stress-responsive transcriptional regulator) n=1 Tax=Mumia flava TaxID=1348852 RepID=A0A2M9BKE3_9ACTN|nr:PspC domain-containing protein [Mumia flava]PJJ58419.1 phage shock protein PspC (stress-responsive transcriptional regulator) [Mumia flava]